MGRRESPGVNKSAECGELRRGEIMFSLHRNRNDRTHSVHVAIRRCSAANRRGTTKHLVADSWSVSFISIAWLTLSDLARPVVIGCGAAASR